MPDDELVACARAGDAQALEALLRRCQPDLRRYARRHCASHDVDDAVQDAMWIVARRVPTLRVAAALSSWLFVTVRRLCMRLLKQRQPTEPLNEEEPFHAVESQDALRLDLARALEELAPIYREVLVLVDVMGHTVPEAADALSVGLETTKSRLHRARALMRRRLTL
ncbi:sigma-70 family RNA polymerase sigma factor [Roseateles sp.]|uniref:RNA polymerase sigma factor n=1 Tax=Roseateles sp. TaxID=1971397 RepID=UPI0032673B00